MALPTRCQLYKFEKVVQCSALTFYCSLQIVSDTEKGSSIKQSVKQHSVER